MPNYLKYGKISELCGTNGYFAGKKTRVKNAPAAPNIFPCGEGNSHIFLWGGRGEGERIQFLVRIYSPAFTGR